MRHAVGRATTDSTLGAALPLTQFPWHSSRPPACPFENGSDHNSHPCEDSAGEGATAVHGGPPHTFIHPACSLCSWRIPRADANPKEATRPLLLHGDPSQNTTRDTSQQYTDLWVLSKQRELATGSLCCSTCPPRRVRCELRLSTSDEAKTILNVTKAQIECIFETRSHARPQPGSSAHQ